MDVADQLCKLASVRDEGVLSDKELAAPIPRFEMKAVVDTQRRLQPVARVLFESPLWALAAGVLCLSGLLNGVYRAPNASVIASIAADPFSPPELGRGSFLLSSPLGPLVSWAVGAREDTSFLIVQGVLTAVAVMGVAYLMRRWHGDVVARLFLVALFCSPLSNLLVGWIGQPDPFTLVSATLLVAGPRWACLAGGLALGFNHFEQGAFIVAAAVMLRRADRSVMAALVGLGAGKLGLMGFHAALDIDAGADRIAYLRAAGMERYLVATFANLPTLVFSVLGVMWAPFLWFLLHAERRRALTVGALQFALLAPVALTLDSTRVWALMSWPVVVHVLLSMVVVVERECLRLWSTLLFLTAVVVPRVVVWEGSVVVSNYRRMVDFVPLL